MNALTPVGLYSIGVRGLDVPELLAWAHRHQMGFMHLRGCHRGYDLTRQTPETLERWRRAARTTVPITGVTADLDLAHIHAPDPGERHRARRKLAALSAAAQGLGAGWVRLLARHPLTAPEGGPIEAGLPLLVELHHPGWWAPAPHRALLDLLQTPHLGVLADTAQFTHALATIGTEVLDRWQRVGPHVRVLHLSDDGSGLTDPGHALVASDIAHRIRLDQQVEVAVEWTGLDRTPAACLRRHRTHTRWWHRIVQGTA